VTTIGLHSPLLAAVRELRTKRGRHEQGRFAVEGPTMLAEALAAGLRPEAVYLTEAARASLPAPLEAVSFLVAERAMARLSGLETPPGILAVFPLRVEPLEAILADGGPGIVLAGVADPGNAGSLLRSAEIFGFAGAVFLADSVEPHNPKVVRASMGAIFRLKVATCKAAELATAAARAGYTVVAAARGGEQLPGFRFPERCLIAIGNERHGVAAYLPQIERAVAIPQPGGGESLNAAVAGAIIFYAFSQQFGAKIFDPQTRPNP
jgi:TrmH family RNA methyltransferase